MGASKKNPPVKDHSRRRRLAQLVAAYAAVLAFACFLLFYNLDGHLLWGDEAETATLAKNVLRFGIPKTFDGVNRITLYGAENDANQADIWVWSPWLQEYVAAGAFWCFGPTTWASRAPFALAAWLALGLLARLVFRVYRDHRVALSALLLLGTSEVFLLQVRQCRYYSLSVFAEILFCYGLYQLLTQNRKGAWTLAGALILQFYSNYIIALANLPVLLPLAWRLFRREKRAVLPLGLSLGLLLVVAAPWLAYAKPWRTQANVIGHGDLALKLAFYVREFHFHFVPLAFLLLPAAAWLAGKAAARRKALPRDQAARKKPQDRLVTAADTPGVGGPLGGSATAAFEWLLLLLLPLYLGTILVAPGQYLRYLLPLLPVACLLFAVWVYRYWPRLALVLVCVQCLSNLLALGTGYPWRGAHSLRWPLYTYMRGITHPYSDRLTDVLAFLQREGSPGQTVYVFDPEFPLIFYTQFKLVDARLINGLITEPLPNWILSESASGLLNLPTLDLPPALEPYYETITIPSHDTLRRAPVPEPDSYQYDTAAPKPYVLYRKKPGSSR